MIEKATAQRENKRTEQGGGLRKHPASTLKETLQLLPEGVRRKMEPSPCRYVILFVFV